MFEEMKATEKKAGMKPKNLRYDNYMAVSDLFRQYGQLTMRDITDRISLSRTSVGKIVNCMIENEDIKLLGKGTSTESGGKRPDIYVLNSQKIYTIGIAFWDMGCEGRMYDLKYNLIHSIFWQTEKAMTDDEVIECMAKMVHRLLDESGTEEKKLYMISLQSAGLINEDGVLVQPVKYSGFSDGFQVVSRMKERLDLDVEIYYDNVSRFSAYYELLNHPERKNREIMVVTSDGIRAGGAVIINGEFFRGFENMAGEFGHVPVSYDGKVKCDCGNFGCFEAMISEKHLRQRMCEMAEECPASELTDDFSYTRMFDLADQGDALAKALLDEMIRYLQILLGNAKYYLNPAEIILQGIFAYPCDYMRRKITKI